jgi:hypothetical protein
MGDVAHWHARLAWEITQAVQEEGGYGCRARKPISVKVEKLLANSKANNADALSSKLFMQANLVAGNLDSSIDHLLHARHIKIRDPQVPAAAAGNLLHQVLCCRHIATHTIVLPVELNQVNRWYGQSVQGARNPLHSSLLCLSPALCASDHEMCPDGGRGMS